jgi:hypothetical protein
MRIYIPTKGRVSMQKTLKALPTALLTRYQATLVCPHSEVNQLNELYGDKVDVAGTFAQEEGICATRQWILEDAAKSADPLVMMLDDDIGRWFVRVVNGSKVQARPASDQELLAGFAHFEEVMNRENYIHGAFGHRLFSNNRPEFNYACFMRSAICLRHNYLKDHKIKYRLPVMEDLDVQLNLLKLGHSNLEYNRILWDDNLSQMSEGGCSTFLTTQLQQDCADQLAALHPGLVKVVHKSDGWPTVRVSWKKALYSSTPYVREKRL